MSHARIYTIEPNGEATPQEKLGNSWGGAPVIWREVWDRFGPPGRTPGGWIDMKVQNQLWELWRKHAMSTAWKVVFISTFDRFIVEPENFHKLAEYYREFEKEVVEEGANSILSTIASRLESTKDVRGIAFHWTSVSESQWYRIEEERDLCIPYNIDKESEHYFLFEWLKEQEVL